MLQIPYSKSEIMHLNCPKWDFNIPPSSQFKFVNPSLDYKNLT